MSCRNQWPRLTSPSGGKCVELFIVSLPPFLLVISSCVFHNWVQFVHIRRTFFITKGRGQGNGLRDFLFYTWNVKCFFVLDLDNVIKKRNFYVKLQNLLHIVQEQGEEVIFMCSQVLCCMPSHFPSLPQKNKLPKKQTINYCSLKCHQTY